MDFTELELDDKLVQAVEEAGYNKPTNVQSAVIPEALNGMDILADAPTGTGKTAAYVLPCLQHLIDFPAKKIGLCRILVLTPTRELALQVSEHIKKLSAYLNNITTGTIIGGVQHEEQLPVLTEKTDIVVATPGRLLEYLRKDSFDIRAVEILVLDEADRMLDMGFIDDVTEISKRASRREQTMLFSATLEGNLLTKFANEVLKKPVEIHIDSPRSERKKINQYNYFADDIEHKIKLLEAILKSTEVTKSIVFVKTRERLTDLSSRLQKDGFIFTYLSGELTQDKRVLALESFVSGKTKILVATDVAARGIDVEDISHVINFDLPRSADVYVHRIGRTARAGKKGTAVNLVEAHDIPMLTSIQHYTGDDMDTRVIDGLRPEHKIADFTKKKKEKNSSETDEPEEEKKHHKDRLRDKKNKGKPDFLAKKKKKLLQEGHSEEDTDKIIQEINDKTKDFKKAKKHSKMEAERAKRAVDGVPDGVKKYWAVHGGPKDKFVKEALEEEKIEEQDKRTKKSHNAEKKERYSAEKKFHHKKFALDHDEENYHDDYRSEHHFQHHDRDEDNAVNHNRYEHSGSSLWGGNHRSSNDDSGEHKYFRRDHDDYHHHNDDSSSDNEHSHRYSSNGGEHRFGGHSSGSSSWHDRSHSRDNVKRGGNFRSSGFGHSFRRSDRHGSEE